MQHKTHFLVLSLLTLLALSFTKCTQKTDSNSDSTITKTTNHYIFGNLNPKAPPETIQFGQLVGKWNCTAQDLLPDSTWHKSKATWTFKYTLDGFAIEDTWVEKVSDSTKDSMRLGRDFTGINMRLYNPQQEKWQCVWLDNRQNTISSVWQATYDKNKKAIIMSDNSENWKITFFNMSETNFDWTYEVLTDNKWITMAKIKGAKVK